MLWFDTPNQELPLELELAYVRPDWLFRGRYQCHAVQMARHSHSPILNFCALRNFSHLKIKLK